MTRLRRRTKIPPSEFICSQETSCKDQVGVCSSQQSPWSTTGKAAHVWHGFAHFNCFTKEISMRKPGRPPDLTMIHQDHQGHLDKPRTCHQTYRQGKTRLRRNGKPPKKPPHKTVMVVWSFPVIHDNIVKSRAVVYISCNGAHRINGFAPVVHTGLCEQLHCETVLYCSWNSIATVRIIQATYVLRFERREREREREITLLFQPTEGYRAPSSKGAWHGSDIVTLV
mmetsp:Transcript_12623/g.37974  ORF Transcript_12623/g.37974 Transcript_12623/m.37974 type:complete len:226 (+) Transcript_12623:2177-2854(+)